MADEDEEADLLTRASSDNEELSDNEQLLIIAQQHETGQTNSISSLERTHFIVTALLIIISSTCLLILLPLYTQSVNLKGDAYTGLLFLSSASTVLFFVVAFAFGMRYGFKAMLWLPYSISKLSRASLIFGLSGILVIYALDRNRVLCHIQDPMKGIVLVFSLVFYFCFCHKMLGLQKIFCSTTIVVGLFISIDYGLCDEFRCRGHERQSKSDDAGSWSWQAHTLWTLVYVAGLALWALHYTLLEEMVVNNQESYSSLFAGSSLLATVSRLVSTRDSSRLTLIEQDSAAAAQPRRATVLPPGLRAVTLASWIHLVSLVLTVSLSWTDMVDVIGATSSSAAFWNVTGSGLRCLLSAEPACSPVRTHAWLTLVAYAAFTLATLHMLVLAKSAVVAVAVATAGLPLAGIWWALFQLNPNGVTMTWSPAVTGELICSLLGLPVVLAALCVLCKSYVSPPATHYGRVRDQPHVQRA